MRYRHIESEVLESLKENCPKESQDLYVISAGLDYGKKEVGVVLLDGTEFRVPFDFFTGEKNYHEWVVMGAGAQPDFSRIAVGELGRVILLGSFSVATEAMTVAFLGKDPDEISERVTPKIVEPDQGA